MPFNQSMTIPLELRLLPTPDGPRLAWIPVKELASLRAKTHDLPARKLSAGSPNPLAAIEAELVELRAEFEPGSATEVAFNIRGATIIYNPAKQEISVNGHRAPAPLRNGRQRLMIYCDRMGLEIFASDGLTYVPMPFIPRAEDRALELRVSGGEMNLRELQVHELRSAWKVPN
jgi:sucrose-6-phosphate hydrolase SacC (GH32 family)